MGLARRDVRLLSDVFGRRVRHHGAPVAGNVDKALQHAMEQDGLSHTDKPWQTMPDYRWFTKQ